MPVERNGFVYAGIDEAGYGPRLGPLCVGLTALRVGAVPGCSAPSHDFWRTLRPAVCRTPGAKRRGKVAVNDSKLLKLPNSSKGAGPLEHLEAGVFAFLACAGHRPATDLELFEALGARLEPHAWYAGDGAPAPVSTTAERIVTLANALGACMAGRAVETLEMQCRVVGEAAFNDGFAARGSKAAVSFDAVASLLGLVWSRWGEAGAHVAVDRQGGRRRYAELLEVVAPGARVDVVAEGESRSVYELSSAPGAGPARRMTVEFEVGADSRHFPTALASMVAKLVRECAMARFNRHWGARLADLKPTAGYGADATRWLRDAAPVIGEAERRALVRIA